MTEYDIKIEGYESGLTAHAIEQVIENEFGSQDVDITVEEIPTDE